MDSTRWNHFGHYMCRIPNHTLFPGHSWSLMRNGSRVPFHDASWDLIIPGTTIFKAGKAFTILLSSDFQTFPHRVQGPGEHLWGEDKMEVGGLGLLTSTSTSSPALVPFERRIIVQGLRAGALKSDSLRLNPAPPLTACETRVSYLTTCALSALSLVFR